ncbi:MAG: Fe-S cluster assembly protein SufD [Gammaproteobacteria bacterium]|nr:Fe-S cluster assembly protein SufD [Gammaproteobacteria bacterium]
MSYKQLVTEFLTDNRVLEDWKYTDLTHLENRGFTLGNKVSHKQCNYEQILSYIDQDNQSNQNNAETTIVFIDGYYNPELSGNAVVNLSLDLNQDGVIINLSDNNILNNLNIKILNFYTHDSHNKVINIKNVLNIASNKNINLTEEYINIDNNIELNSNFLLEINLSSGSVLDHYILQDQGKNNYHLAAYIINQSDGSEYYNYNINIGSKLARQDIIVNQNGDNTVSNLYGLFLPQKTQHMDSHLKVFHNGSNGKSLQSYRGVLSDRGRGVWNGMVYVKAGTKGNAAIQSNKNLLLSKNAEIYTKPELQIYSEDVSCTHGATIGRLDEKALFYLQSRGIPKEEANQLLINAFMGSIISVIKDSVVLDWINHNLDVKSYV